MRRGGVGMGEGVQDRTAAALLPAIGAAVTLAALREARVLGDPAGALGASGLDRPAYRRIGFRGYCTIGIDAWRSPPRGVQR